MPQAVSPLLLTGFLTAAIAIACDGVPEAHASPLCTDVDKGTGLDANHQNAWPSAAVFSDGARAYPASVIAVWEAPEGSLMCIRYDIRNTGSEGITEFRWPEVGVGFTTLTPGEELPWPRYFVTKYDHPTKKITDLKAFRSATAPIETYFPIEMREHASSAPGTTATLASWSQYVPDSAYSELATVMDSYGFDEIGIAQADTDSDINLPRIVVQFRLNGDVFNYSSFVQDFGDSIKVVNYFSLASDEGSTEGRELFGPAFSSMAAVEVAQPPRWAAADLATIATKEAQSDRIGNREFMSVEYKKSDVQHIYLVEHSLLLETPSGQSCINLQTYSVIPISTSETYCEQRRIN